MRHLSGKIVKQLPGYSSQILVNCFSLFDHVRVMCRGTFDGIVVLSAAPPPS